MGLKRRLSRLFGDDGRSLVVAMDHGTGLDVHPALRDPGVVLDAVVRGGADAVLLSPGLLREYGGNLGSLGVILRVDGGSTSLSENGSTKQLLHSVEDALRLGADAVACMGFPGSPCEAQTLANLAALVAEGQRWGVPVMAEMVPGGLGDLSGHTAERVRFAVRIGCELGADLIKTTLVEPLEEFGSVIAHAYKPVLVLGGSRKRDEATLLRDVRLAVAAGAAGVAMGRCLWSDPSPGRLVRLLRDAIHSDDGAAPIDLRKATSVTPRR